ncbi:MAG: hydrogenase 2 operon protein HybA [Candidatus Accumulibacter phosphatis]|jgi:Fe-S-cluster-containing dehydrogenase component|uniref:Formate dehydrogenase-N subunit beta n=2 Tax=Candidatus Accumulibacter TaxID=327159 RepID=A0A080LTG5_9PROT|nr:hydrogenase 2 operon protein HybA [Candidatus Accumulibacter contiguus]KFB71802.1 MAG: Formate dehydrogenase-N subunit beta [Candidatus Accumulibacter phosphatis]MBL8407351.1 hydrogenase 2 operon protein HybA [Accumulibacter sp.]NMQ06877.1 hydrogenase 2 operon protein HybA [Candidatus Accumulibacter contiguus]HRF11987.1 hydrogenase 2 operon protein HybA [Candidatus Accumulibacter phosphatis]
MHTEVTTTPADENSRRKFLKGCVNAAGAAVTAGTVSSTVEARDTYQRPPEALGLLYDATLCIGCKACVAACKRANDNPAEFSTADKLWDTPLDTSGYTFNIIKMYRSGTMSTKDDESNGYAFMKTSCMHCADPSCVSACPVTAMTKDPRTGIVAYDPEACVGCRYCVVACPFGIPKYQYDSPTGKIGKCELCRHRYQEGHYSACAEVCPTGATLYGRTSDLLIEARRRLALKPGSTTIYPRGNLSGGQDQSYEGYVGKYQQHIYGETEYGGTQVLKLSAVDFEKVGMPYLAPKSSASTSETIQHTLYGGLLMPFAVLGAMTYVARRNVHHEDDASAQEAGKESS